MDGIHWSKGPFWCHLHMRLAHIFLLTNQHSIGDMVSIMSSISWGFFHCTHFRLGWVEIFKFCHTLYWTHNTIVSSCDSSNHKIMLFKLNIQNKFIPNMYILKGSQFSIWHCHILYYDVAKCNNLLKRIWYPFRVMRMKFLWWRHVLRMLGYCWVLAMMGKWSFGTFTLGSRSRSFSIW